MILRNPSLTRDFLFMACSFFFLLTIPLSAQGLKGSVREFPAGQPVSNATVRLMKGDSLVSMLLTDTAGQYEYVTDEAGRYSLEISALGYEHLLVDDIALNGYSTQHLDHFLKSNPYALQGVIVIAPILPYVETISAQDLEETAANFDDPVRVATSRPGIVQINDQANHISVRGQNPFFNSWYLEGLEIVNPSHTNNAGTFTDYPTQSGGGINMFSAQILGATDIYTGINPLSVGRSAGGVINMHLHESAQKEFRMKAGLIGFELGHAIPVGQRGMLDLNARYSFTGLLAALGVDFGGEEISFQDVVASFSRNGMKHDYKIYSWGGSSENEFKAVERQEDKEKYKDFFNIDFSDWIGGIGFKSNLRLDPVSVMNSGISLSASNSYYDRTGTFGPEPVSIHLHNKIYIVTAFTEFNLRHSNRFNSTAGLNYTYRDITSFGPLNDESFIRPYLSTKILLAQGLTTELGAEMNYSFLQPTSIPGYRATLEWATSAGLIHAGYRHAAGHTLINTLNPDQSRPYLVDKYELGWNKRITNHFLSLTGYYQKLDQLTIYFSGDDYVNLADQSDFAFGEVIDQNGLARYYGVEAEWKFRNAKSWAWTINQTFYKSETTREEIPFTTGKFDGRFSSHLLVSKEIIREKKGKNRIWNFGLRGTLQGGLNEPTIDTESSETFETTIFLDPNHYNQQLPLYKRVDFSISRTLANPKSKWRFALDIQNVIGFHNEAYRYYDPFLQQITVQEHLGIIPVLSVQHSR